MRTVHHVYWQQKVITLTLVFGLILVAMPAHAGDSVTAGNSPYTGTVGCHISTSVGEYYFSKPLLDLGGPLPLRFSLHYGSRLDKWLAWDNDPFGGDLFTHSLHMTLRLTGANALGIFFTDGDLLWFKREDGAWRIMMDEVNYQLKEDADFFYLLDPLQGLIYTFAKTEVRGGGASGGLLVRIEDRNGNALTFTNDPVSHRLTRVSDGLGRTLDFTYIWEYAHLARVTDGAGRSVQFQYTWPWVRPDAVPLAAVTDTLGLRTMFWHVPPNLLTRQVLPRGNAPYTQAYAQDPQRSWVWRVVAQTDAYSQTTRLAFDTPITGTTTITDPLVSAYRHTHEGWRRLTGLRDASGLNATWGYDDLGRPITITDRMGDVSTLTYHAETGRIASVTNAKGQAITYTFSAQSQTFTNPLSPTLTYSFTFYNLTRVDYPDGTSEQYAYDGRGNALTYTDQAGQLWQYTYNNRGQMLTGRTPAGGVMTYTYNADGTLASSTDSDTGITTYGYDALKRLTRITYPDGASVQMAYDAGDRLTSITDPNGRAYTFQHDANGNLTQVTDPLGNSTQYSYDLMDRLVQSTDRLGKVRRWSYDALGRVASFTDPTNVVTTYGYDPRGWLNSVTQGGKTWQLSYDNEGVPVSLTVPSGSAIAFENDLLGYSSRMTDALGNSASVLRDALQRVTAITDPLGRTTAYEYDARGLLAAVTQPVIGGTSYENNALGLLARLTDPLGAPWGFSYTGMGRMVSSTDPLSRNAESTYDSRGRLQRLVLPDGTIASFSYDWVNNLTRLQYSTGLDLHYTYDALDRLSGAAGIQFAHDAEGRVTDTTTSGRSFGATYDDAGRLKTATYNDAAFAVTYTYSPTTGLLTRVSDNLTGAWVDLVYDQNLRLAGTRRSNGLHATFTWDDAGRLTRIQDGPAAGSPLLDLQYTLDAAGQVTQASILAPLDLASVITAAGSINLSYDAASQISSVGYSYDAQGRLTSAPGHTYAWDGASRLVGIDAVRLDYNGLGDVITRTEGMSATGFFYNYAVDGMPIVAEMTDGSGGMGAGELESEEAGGRSGASASMHFGTPAPLRYYVWTPQGQLLYMIDAAHGNKVYFYHFDRTGSTLALSDGLGNVTDAYAYEPYGRLLAHQGSNAQPFTFQGRYGVRQEGVGGTLYHVRARYYDAATARFLSPDPVWPGDPGLPASPYVYANANPLLFGDMTGAQGDFSASFDVYFSPPSPAPPTKPINPAKVMQSMRFDLIDKPLARGANWSLDYQKFGGTYRVVYQNSEGMRVLGKTTEETLKTAKAAGGWLGSLSLSVQINYMMWDLLGSHLREQTDPNRPEAVEYRLRQAAEEEQRRAADEQRYAQHQANIAAEMAAIWQERFGQWRGTGVSEADIRDMVGRLAGLYGEGTQRYKEELQYWIKFAKARPQPPYTPQFQTKRDIASKLIRSNLGLFGFH